MLSSETESDSGESTPFACLHKPLRTADSVDTSSVAPPSPRARPRIDGCSSKRTRLEHAYVTALAREGKLRKAAKQDGKSTVQAYVAMIQQNKKVTTYKKPAQNGSSKECKGAQGFTKQMQRLQT